MPSLCASFCLFFLSTIRKPENMKNLTQYTIAAFISAGMHRDTVILDAARDKLGTGCFELVQTGVAYTDLACDMAAAGFSIVADYPGVFEYEVCEEFGVWYVRAALANNTLPEAVVCAGKLRDLTHDFFSRVTWKAPYGETLRAALNALPTPPQPEL